MKLLLTALFAFSILLLSALHESTIREIYTSTSTDKQLHSFEQTGDRADIGPLTIQGTFLTGLLPDSQRYFEYNHTKNDVFENVHRRELEPGAAAVTAIVYLLDQEGI